MKRQTSFRSGANINRFRADTDFPWPLINMGDIVTLHYGKALTERARRPGHVPVYGTNGRTGWHDTALGQGPTVILGRKGMGNLGVEWCAGPFWVIDTAYYTSFREDVLPHFFYYFTNYVGLNHLKDGTSNPSLSRDTFARQLFPLPPINEQQRVASLLSMLDDKIELNRRMNETLESMARALFQSWFVDFDPVRAKAEGRQVFGMKTETAALFPDSFQHSRQGKIPKGWMVTPLPEAVQINPPRSLTKREKATYLDMQNMPTQGHRPSGWVTRPYVSGSRFSNGDTLVARITPCLENGKTAFVDFLKDGEVGWGSTEFIVVRPQTPLPPEYGYCLARDKEFRDFAIQNMTGSSGRQRVPTDCFQHYSVVIPPEPIASRFGQFIQPLFAKAKANSEEAATLATLRDTLLPKLLSGAVRVQDAEQIIS